MSHPNARQADLIVQSVEPDTLVYDQLRDRAHSLGPVAGYVFRTADGSRSAGEIASRMSTDLGVTDDPKVVHAALWELERAQLLQDAGPTLEGATEITRREAVRRFGRAAIAIAAVTSIAAPTPAMARSRGNIKPPKGPKPKKPKKPKSSNGNNGNEPQNKP